MLFVLNRAPNDADYVGVGQLSTYDGSSGLSSCHELWLMEE